MQGALGLTDWDNSEFFIKTCNFTWYLRFCMQELCLFFFFLFLAGGSKYYLILMPPSASIKQLQIGQCCILTKKSLMHFEILSQSSEDFGSSY